MFYKKMFGIMLDLSFLFVIINKISGEGICDKTKITVRWPNGTKQCFACVKCRRGWGLTYSCGDVLDAPLQKPIKCVRCRKRQTFSPGLSSDACKTCTPCRPNHQRIKKCTRSADTKCGAGCKKGYYKFRDPHFSSCEKCSSCCWDGKDKWIEECAKQGLPTNLRCSFRHDRQNCSRSLNPQTPSQKVPLSKMSTTVRKTMTTTVTMQPAAVESNNPIINNNSVSGPAANEWHAVGIGVPVSVLLLITVLVVGGIWHKRDLERRYTSVQRNSTSDESSNREQERHEPGEDDGQNVVAKEPSRPLKEFIVDPDEWSAYNEFCSLLNTKVDPHMEEHFYSISHAFGIDLDTAKMIMEEKRGAAQALFDYLVRTKSDPGTLEKMAGVLDRLTGRDAAAKILRDADHRLKQKACALQQEAYIDEQESI